MRVALPTAAVVRVVEPGAAQPAPAAHAALWGLVREGERFLPLLHLGALLGIGDRPETPSDTAVIVECGTGAVALVVEGADDVVRREPSPLPGGFDVPWASGVVREGERVVPIVDVEVLADRLARARGVS